MTLDLERLADRRADDETPHALAARIEAEFVGYLETTRRLPTPHPDRVFASQYRACERQMFYDCTTPQSATPYPTEVLGKFLYGNERETSMILALIQAGRRASPPIRIIQQQQRCTLRDRKGREAITGKIDGFIESDGETLPFELKNWSPYLTDKIATFADVLDNPYTRPGAFQILAYMVAFGHAWGMLVLDRSGVPRFIPVTLSDDNLDHVETFLATAERVLDHVAAGTTPDYTTDAPTCKRCPYFGTVCNPPLLADVPNILIDPDLESALERREQLKAAGKQYLDLDADLKRRLRGVEHALIGSFEISGAWSKSSRVELPADLKKQYTVTDPRGRFTLDIERLPQPENGGATHGEQRQPTTTGE